MSKKNKLSVGDLNPISEMVAIVCDVYSSAGGSNKKTEALFQEVIQIMENVDLSKKHIEHMKKLSVIIVLTIHKAHELGESGVELECLSPLKDPARAA